MGSKNRIAKQILPIILKDRKEGQWYVEPFCGGCNTLDKVKGNRIGGDASAELIGMWKALIYGRWTPEKIGKDFYESVRALKDKYPLHVRGWVGFNCSYAGKYFGGFAGETSTKIGTVRDYQAEAISNVLKQVEALVGVDFYNCQYSELCIPENSLIYCDPPYSGTTEYAQAGFDHALFWDWCRIKTTEGHSVFISEYSAPADFKTVWSGELTSSLSANGKAGGSKTSIEKLFTYVPTYPELD